MNLLNFIDHSHTECNQDIQISVQSVFAFYKKKENDCVIYIDKDMIIAHEKFIFLKMNNSNIINIIFNTKISCFGKCLKNNFKQHFKRFLSLIDNQEVIAIDSNFFSFKLVL